MVGAMVRTPWGNAEALRDRKLRPGPGVSREEVVRNQRERLFAAMVAAVADGGYAATTVADLIALSGVSRTAFYEQFANKEECFVAAVREILERTSGAVAGRYDGHGSALAAFIDQIVAQPDAARMCFVESFSVGPTAVALMDQTVAGFEGLYQQAFDAREDGMKMPPDLVTAIVGGLRKVIYTKLRRGQEEELSSLAEPLAQWSLGYEPPPKPLRRRARVAADNGGSLYRPNNPADRIIAAATETIAERGYAATTIAEIVERASASLSTFYEHFDDKEDVFVAALDAGQAQMLAVTLPAYRRAKEWPAAVRISYEAMLDFLAAHPAFARIALVEILSGTTRALERRDRLLESLFVFLDPGYERAPKTEPIAAEAIGGAAYELVYRQVRDAGPQGLPQITPLLTYITLAPFLGAEEACAAANGDGRARSR
jgi:AcrR family transcriptional regulator